MEDPFGGVPAATRALPTPDKTPVVREHLEQNDKEVKTIARNLFGVNDQDAPLTVKKIRKTRNNSISLGFNILADDENIEVFTDPENRVPKTDVTAENPFYGEDGIAASATPVRRSPRNKKAIIEKQTAQQNLKRDDGLLYVL